MSNAFDYGVTRDTADRLLARFGQAVTIRRAANSGAQPWAPTQSTTDYATVAAIVNLTRWYPPTRANTDILVTDRRGIISAGPLTALGVTLSKISDSLIAANGQKFLILDVKPISPAGLICVYDCWLRV